MIYKKSLISGNLRSAAGSSNRRREPAPCKHDGKSLGTFRQRVWLTPSVYRDNIVHYKLDFSVHSYIVLFHQKLIFVLLYVDILYIPQP